jgi:hypothetical protein
LGKKCLKKRKNDQLSGRFLVSGVSGYSKNAHQVDFASCQETSQTQYENRDAHVGLHSLHGVSTPQVKSGSCATTAGASHPSELLQRTQAGLMLKILSKAKSERAGEHHAR